MTWYARTVLHCVQCKWEEQGILFHREWSTFAGGSGGVLLFLTPMCSINVYFLPKCPSLCLIFLLRLTSVSSLRLNVFLLHMSSSGCTHACVVASHKTHRQLVGCCGNNRVFNAKHFHPNALLYLQKGKKIPFSAGLLCVNGSYVRISSTWVFLEYKWLTFTSFFSTFPKAISVNAYVWAGEHARVKQM